MRRFCGYSFLVLWVLAGLWFTVAEFVPQLNPYRVGCRVAGWLRELHTTPEAPPAEPTVSEPLRREAHFVFVGDVMAHLPQVEAAEAGYERYDFAPQFEGLREAFADADYVVGNLETTLSPRPPYSGYPAFCTPVELADAMKDAGFDGVTIANNHVADRGVEGLLATIAGLDDAGLDHFGASVDSLSQGTTRPLIRQVGGVRVALMAYTYGLNGGVPQGMEVGLSDTLTMRRHIESVRGSVDFIFALMHWGSEYARIPNGHQRQLAEWMRRAGVDFVIGSHPHVVQPFEEWRNESGKVEGGVFYSLGNFISNQNDPYTDYGLVAHVRISCVEGEDADIAIEADTVRRLRYDLDGRRVYRTTLVGETP